MCIIIACCLHMYIMPMPTWSLQGGWKWETPQAPVLATYRCATRLVHWRIPEAILKQSHSHAMFLWCQRNWVASRSMLLLGTYNTKKNQVRYSVQSERAKKSPSRNPESKGFCLDDFWGGWTKYRTFFFSSRDFFYLNLHGELLLFIYCHVPKVFHQ